MEKLSRRRRSCLVSACGTRLLNNRLSETCAHHCLSAPNLCDAQTGCPTRASRPITLSLVGRQDWQTCAELLNSGTFLFCFFLPLIIVLIQSSTSKAEREIGLEKVTWWRNFGMNAINLRGWGGKSAGQDGVLTSEMLHKSRSQAILS